MNSRTTFPDKHAGQAVQAHLDSARVLARGGEHQAALDSLERVIEAGYTTTFWWTTDSDLKTMSNDSRFQRLIEKVSGVDDRT